MTDPKKLTDERGAVYGHPAVDFDRAARLKAVVAEVSDPRLRHALEMICVKMARLIQSPTHLDSWDDIAGYARCGRMVVEYAAPSKATAGQGVFVHCGVCPHPAACFSTQHCSAATMIR